MEIKAKVHSSEKDNKTGITTMKIITEDIEDNISWVGRTIYILLPEYGVVRK